MISRGLPFLTSIFPRQVLPANLAVPWTGIANHLGLCPVVCHAAVVLWNYRLLDQDGPIDLRYLYPVYGNVLVKHTLTSLLRSNLTTLATYSGSLDEAWFYLVTTAIESAGAPCLRAIVNSIEHVRDGNVPAITADLETIRTSLEHMNDALQRMYEKCDPYVFYWKIRPYLAGWENMAEAGLPFGLIYEGVDSLWAAETDEYADMSHLSEGERLLRQYRRYAGGSAAQSSLIAALDVALGVEHFPTGERNPGGIVNDRYRRLPPPNPADDLKSGQSTPTARASPPPFVRTNRNAFLRAMRKYMPKEHRQFLEDLEIAANLRSFMLHLEEHADNLSDDETKLVQVYNDCLGLLKAFRDKHVQIVTLYIVNQARKGPNIAHGGFAIESKIAEDDIEKPAKRIKTEDGVNVLYPQTALETAPAIRKGSISAKVSRLFPELGLAKHVDPKTGVVRGTGGTNVLPFLKQSRDETAESRIVLTNELAPTPSSTTTVSTPPPSEAPPSLVPQRKSWRSWLLSS